MTDTGEQPRRGGHKPFQPTDEQRKNDKILVGLGVPERAICAIVRDHKDRPKLCPLEWCRSCG
jgi:hypothetical protein